MASIFGNSQSVIMVDYLEETIKDVYYAKELRRVRQEIMKKRKVKMIRCVLLSQDNAPAHISQVVMAAATKYRFEALIIYLRYWFA